VKPIYLKHTDIFSLTKQLNQMLSMSLPFIYTLNSNKLYHDSDLVW